MLEKLPDLRSAMRCAGSAPAWRRPPSSPSTCAAAWRPITVGSLAFADHAPIPRALHRRRPRRLAAAAMDRRTGRRGVAGRDRRGRRRADAASAGPCDRRRPAAPVDGTLAGGRAAEPGARRQPTLARPQLVPAGGLAAARSAARPRRASLCLPGVRARPAASFDGTPGRDAVLEAIREHGPASGCLIGTYERPDASIKSPVDERERGVSAEPRPRDLSAAVVGRFAGRRVEQVRTAPARRASSIASRRRLVAVPPGAEKPPRPPPAATTRWHGTMIGNGLRPSDWPTSRAVGVGADPGRDLAVGEDAARRESSA